MDKVEKIITWMGRAVAATALVFVLITPGKALDLIQEGLSVSARIPKGRIPGNPICRLPGIAFFSPMLCRFAVKYGYESTCLSVGKATRPGREVMFRGG